VIPALAATLAIVVQDHTPIRAAPSSGGAQLTALSQGDVLEIRGERAGYLKVYNYRRERGGYLREDKVRPIGLNEAEAPQLLAVLRFLRDTPGSEALGISYGAAYLKAIPPRALTAEPFDAIARMAERLADAASGNGTRLAEVAAHLEVVQQFGIHMRSVERGGRMQVCYDGELFRRVLAQAGASSEERAHAALGLTRPDCIDPDLGTATRATLDDERRELLDAINERDLSAISRSRLHARRAGVLAAIAYAQARRGDSPRMAAQRAHAELLAVNANDLGDDRRVEYEDAVLRVGAVRWAFSVPATILKGAALVLAVQPLESWRELWLFHAKAGVWTIDVLSPGADDPEEGYVEFAGVAPGSRRLLIAREVKDRGRFRRRFEELRLDDLALVRQASSPELLRDFGWWQDVAWRRDTLALH
jgi:hypothetical protein